MRDSFEVGPLDKQQGEQEEQQAVFAPADSRPNRFGIALAMLSLYFIWGSTYLGIRIAIESIPPLLMIGVRFLVAGGILYLVLRVRGVPSPKRSQWMGSAAVGVLLIGGGMRSEEHTSELQSPDHLVCRLLLEKKKNVKS